MCKYRDYFSSEKRETDTSTNISGRRRSHWQNSRKKNKRVIKTEEERQWWRVFCEIIPSCILKCYTLMRVLILRDKGEEPKPAGQWTTVSQRFINNICSPGAMKVMWAQKKVLDLEAIIPQKQPSQPTSVSADASHPTAWKDAGGRLMNWRPRMCCILGHCGLQSETLSNKTEEGGEEKEGGDGSGGSGRRTNNKRKQNPG